MTVLEDAMEEHMAYIVFHEHRPFSYKDFSCFEVDGIQHKVDHGTFRNKISNMMKNENVEVHTKSNPRFYTLKGYRFDNLKLMTPNRMVVSKNNFFYNMILELPLDKQSIHNIRLKFRVKDIWNIFAMNPNYSQINTSKDIQIPSKEIDGIDIKITIHKSNTVAVILGCSINPIPLDAEGLILLSTTLARIEERISNLIQSGKKNELQIPEYLKWIVTMWHFGRDSLTDYIGEKFSITFEEGLASILRAYVKEKPNKRKKFIRLERQECPKRNIQEVINERLNERTIHESCIK